MIETMKNAWKVAELRQKILFTLLCILVYRFGYAIYVPYVDSHALAQQFAAFGQSNILTYFNILAGGGLAPSSIVRYA